MADLSALRKQLIRTDNTKSVLSKCKNVKKATTKSSVGGSNAYEKVKNLCDLVKRRLGKYATDFTCIQDYDTFVKYIDKSIENGYMSIDTETTGLDPICDELVGVCLYTPGEKPAYIPVNHKSLVTGNRLNNQLNNTQIAEQIIRLNNANVKNIFFNAKFDIRVLKNQTGVELSCYWDASIAAKVLKFNEEEQNLKYLWKKYCSPDKDAEHFTFDKMFEGHKFDIIPIDTAYLYAAKDAIMTWELYKFQEPYLTENGQRAIECGTDKLAYVFHKIESPIISLVAGIEDNGVAIDKNYCQKLSTKYHNILNEQLDTFYKELENYKDKLISWISTHPQTKIQTPLNIGSPIQLAELFYDVLGLEPVSKKQPRGTGEEILLKLNHPLSKLILDYRGTAKLLSTYIDKMPEATNKKTLRVHGSYNQIGCDTSRFSSSNPNMQNIPSHNKDIRRMFIASDGSVLIGGDFSKQEPVITADLSGDQTFIELLKSGKDPYSIIASIAFKQPYEECLEFRPDGSTNAEGKERRTRAKSIFLGICYSKSVPSIAEDLKVSQEVAQKIFDDVMTNMPCLKNIMEQSQQFAKQYGYVETKWGTRKYLPDMQLEPYEIKSNGSKNFDPFFDSQELGVVDETEIRKQQILNEINKATFYKEKQKIKERAEKEGFKIKDNVRFIEEARRQCLNGRVQGSAANQSKIALQLIKNNKRLNELGFKVLILVHDEIIGECPVQNAKEVAQLFKQCMLDSGKELAAPVKVDLECSIRWYGKSLDLDKSQEEIIEQYNKIKEYEDSMEI